MAGRWKVHIESLHDLQKPKHVVGDNLKHAKNLLFRNDGLDPDLRNLVVQVTSCKKQLSTRPFHVPKGHAEQVVVDEVLFVPEPDPNEGLEFNVLRLHRHTADALLGQVFVPAQAGTFKLNLMRGHSAHGAITVTLRPALPPSPCSKTPTHSAQATQVLGCFAGVLRRPSELCSPAWRR
mmetsp:Transcript_129322/g.374488  ORF Transcript_129322/g.374488 Transcript_129322/m.374488 type:complete len:179 (+) Transcript_129322:91-627(+)